MDVNLPTGFVSGLISVALFVGSGFVGFCALVLGWVRWRGIQCDPWPIGGPVLCIVSMGLFGLAAMQIHTPVAIGFWLVAFAWLWPIRQAWAEFYAAAPPPPPKRNPMPRAPVRPVSDAKRK